MSIYFLESVLNGTIETNSGKLIFIKKIDQIDVEIPLNINI